MPGFGSELSQLVDQPHELELQAREHLPKLIMQLARDAGALFLTRVFKSQCESA